MVNIVACDLHPSTQSLTCPAKPSRKVQLILLALLLLSPPQFHTAMKQSSDFYPTLIIVKGKGESWYNIVVMGIIYTMCLLTAGSYFSCHGSILQNLGIASLVRSLEFLAREFGDSPLN